MSTYLLTFEDRGTAPAGLDLGSLAIHGQDAHYFEIKMGYKHSVTRAVSGMPREFSCLLDGAVKVDDLLYPDGCRPDGRLDVRASVRIRVEGMADEEDARRVRIDDLHLNQMAALLGPDLSLDGVWRVADVEEEALELAH